MASGHSMEDWKECLQYTLVAILLGPSSRQTASSLFKNFWVCEVDQIGDSSELWLFIVVTHFRSLITKPWVFNQTCRSSRHYKTQVKFYEAAHLSKPRLSQSSNTAPPSTLCSNGTSVSLASATHSLKLGSTFQWHHLTQPSPACTEQLPPCFLLVLLSSALLQALVQGVFFKLSSGIQ